MTWKVLITGLGNIGFKYDLDEDKDVVLTHARAFSLHKGFSLVGGVDPDPNNRDQFAAAYDVPVFDSLSSAVKEIDADVVVIASPTQRHFENFQELAACCKPRLVLMEKPASYTLQQAREMMEIGTRHSIPVLLNLIRRTDPSVVEVKSKIENGEISLPCKGVVWYSKGLIHNACHFVDLLSWWLGLPEKIEVLAPGSKINEFDSEPDLRISFSDSVVYFIAKNNEEFSYYNIELLAENGRLNFGNGSMPVTWQPRNKAGAGLEADCEVIKDELHRYQFNIADDVDRFLRDQSTLLPSLEEHVEIMKLVYEITDVG